MIDPRWYYYDWIWPIKHVPVSAACVQAVNVLFLSVPFQDVMVVGEPTLMGGEFGDEDERLITRLENTQYDATNGLDDEDDFNSSPALGNNTPWSSKPAAAQDTKPESTAPQPSQ